MSGTLHFETAYVAPTGATVVTLQPHDHKGRLFIVVCDCREEQDMFYSVYKDAIGMADAHLHQREAATA